MRLSLLILGFLYVSSLFAGIGENFEKGGYWIGGNGYIYFTNIGEKDDFSFTASLGAEQDYYIVDNLSFGFDERVYFGKRRNPTISISSNISYTFLKNPEASKGPAHRVGFAVGGRFRYDTEMYSSLSLVPSYTFSYFLTERIAPYIKVEGVSDYSFDANRWRFGADVRLGLALYFPVKMRVNVHK